MSISRRDLIASATTIGLGAVTLSTPAASLLSPKKKHLRFVHITDLHIQPELGATEGVNLAVQRILALNPRPDFVICGGDHIMDALCATRDRAESQFDLFVEAMKPLEMPVISVVGNHDVFGWGARHETSSDAHYGKSMIAERILKAPTYRSFDRGGVHFVLLDGIQPSRERSWHSIIDDEQLNWLAKDLEVNGHRPTVVVTHVPILTAYIQYTEGTTNRTSDGIITRNGREVQHILARHNVKAVLQGHTHVLESIRYLNTRYITGGSISGNWWKGPHLGVHPEGFLVCDLVGEELKTKYVPYGWHSQYVAQRDPMYPFVSSPDL